MAKIDPNIIANGFQFNTRVITPLVDGLTHDDSLLVPEFGGNCINWILGHILVSLQRALALVDASLVYDDLSQYETGSEPLAAVQAIPLDELLAALDTAANRAAEGIRTLSEEEMNAPYGDDNTVGGRLHGLYWHETYHIGQLEPLRRLAGHTEKVFG